MTTQNKNEILGAIADTLGDIQGLLQKSQHTKPDGDNPLAKADEPGMEGEGAPAPEDDAGGEQPPAPEGEGAPEGGELEAEGGHEDPAAALAEQAKQLSDQELDHMLEALMAEKEARAGAAGGEGAPAPEGAAPEAAPPAQPDLAEKSMKSEFASLAKSMAGIADAVGKLTTEVVAIKQAQAKPAPAKVTAKPAAANVANAQVLQKSAPAKKRLAKSQTMTFLEGEIRKGNKLVDRHVIAEANLLKTDAELYQFQDRMELEGLKFPEGK